MRVKRGVKARRRRKKILDRASGFYGRGKNCYEVAKNLADRALAYAYRDRKVKKRFFRQLWQIRIGAAARLNGTNYSKLMGALKKAGIELNRKVLSEMAVFDQPGFTALVEKIKPYLNAKA